MDIRILAETLANRPYVEIVKSDKSTDGESVYLAFSPELEGCMGQGQSWQEAIENLREARIDFIQSLIEDNISVPEPQTYPTITTSGYSAKFVSDSQEDLYTVENDAEDFAVTQLLKG